MEITDGRQTTYRSAYGRRERPTSADRRRLPLSVSAVTARFERLLSSNRCPDVIAALPDHAVISLHADVRTSVYGRDFVPPASRRKAAAAVVDRGSARPRTACGGRPPPSRRRGRQRDRWMLDEHGLGGDTDRLDDRGQMR